MVYGVLVVPRKQLFLVAMCCKLFHLGVSIGIGRMCNFL